MATESPPIIDTLSSVLNGSVSDNSTLTNGTLADNFNTTLPPLPTHTTDGKDFFHHLTLKDETTFVALIVMGVIVPAVFVIVFLLICRQRRKDMLARRTQMLLQNAQDFALEDYSTDGKTTLPIVKTDGFQSI